MIALPEDRTPWYTIFKSTEQTAHFENKVWQRQALCCNTDAAKQVTLTCVSQQQKETIIINGLIGNPPALNITRTKEIITLTQPSTKSSYTNKLLLTITVVAGAATVYYLTKQANQANE